MDRRQIAIEKHNIGYNCSQAVACAFCDKVDISESKMFQIMSAFGLGMGGMEGTCGAVSGAIAIIGMLKNDGNPENTKQKMDIYKASKEFTKRFHEKNQSLVCREIKGADTGVVLRSCGGCIEDAVVILEEMIEEGFLQ